MKDTFKIHKSTDISEIIPNILNNEVKMNINSLDLNKKELVIIENNDGTNVLKNTGIELNILSDNKSSNKIYDEQYLLVLNSFNGMLEMTNIRSNYASLNERNKFVVEQYFDKFNLYSDQNSSILKLLSSQKKYNNVSYSLEFPDNQPLSNNILITTEENPNKFIWKNLSNYVQLKDLDNFINLKFTDQINELNTKGNPVFNSICVNDIIVKGSIIKSTVKNNDYQGDTKDIKDSLVIINNLKPLIYVNSNKLSLNLQNVPDIVSNTENLGELVPLLISGIQEQLKQIRNLTIKVEMLQNALNKNK
jgi:hypothetical protein